MNDSLPLVTTKVTSSHEAYIFTTVKRVRSMIHTTIDYSTLPLMLEEGATEVGVSRTSAYQKTLGN